MLSTNLDLSNDVLLCQFGFSCLSFVLRYHSFALSSMPVVAICLADDTQTPSISDFPHDPSFRYSFVSDLVPFLLSTVVDYSRRSSVLSEIFVFLIPYSLFVIFNWLFSRLISIFKTFEYLPNLTIFVFSSNVHICSKFSLAM